MTKNTLIGTTDLDYSGDLDAVRVSPEEIEYLCDAASSYFRAPVTADQVLWSRSNGMTKNTRRSLFWRM